MKYHFIVATVMMLLCTPLFAFDYFNSQIDYWNEGGTFSEKNSSQTKRKNPATESKAFDWSTYLDPENDEFFREGDYIPPTSFMELVRNPTDKNIANWFSLIEMKNKLSLRLQQRMLEYQKKHASRLSSDAHKLISRKSQDLQFLHIDHKRYRFRLYFAYSCPSCKKMLNTMVKLQEMGFYVELRRIGDDDMSSLDVPFPVLPADNAELKEKNINSWPVLFIGDLKEEVAYRLDGFHTVESVLGAISVNKSTNL